MLYVLLCCVSSFLFFSWSINSFRRDLSLGVRPGDKNIVSNLSTWRRFLDFETICCPISFFPIWLPLGSSLYFRVFVQILENFTDFFNLLHNALRFLWAWDRAFTFSETLDALLYPYETSISSNLQLQMMGK